MNRRLRGLLRRLDELDESRLAASAGIDLRFDHANGDVKRGERRRRSSVIAPPGLAERDAAIRQ